MRCPKCESPMETVNVNNVEVDRCSCCNGLWFDAAESEMLRTKKAAAKIDIGDEAQGEHTNPIDRYNCARCSGPMVRMVDARQPHIWYEKCASCGGSFFDAGEFRDLAQISLADFFKSIITPERR